MALLAGPWNATCLFRGSRALDPAGPEKASSGVVNAQSTLRNAGTPRARDTRDELVLTGG